MGLQTPHRKRCRSGFGSSQKSSPNVEWCNSYVHLNTVSDKGLQFQMVSRHYFAKVTTVLNLHLVSFCDNTSLHGLRNVTTKKFHWCERMLWLILCVLGVVMTIFLSSVIWSRFQRSPTVTNVETTAYPVWNVPFPAITLCNNNKVYLPAALKLAENLTLQGLNKSLVMDFLHHLPQLVNPTLDNEDLLYHLAQVEDHLFAMGVNITTLMKQMAQPCDRMLVYCRWKGQEEDCKSLFKVQKSVEGFCCSFNYFGLLANLSEIPRDDGDIRFVNGAGQNAGMSMVLDIESDTYFGPASYFYGLYALLHDPEDYPETSLKKALIQPGQIIWVEVDAKVIESVPGVRRLDPKQRECWFDDEVEKLLSYDSYSYQTCVTECRIQTIIQHCGCIPFYYLHIYDEPTCGLRNVACLLKLPSILNRHEVKGSKEIGLNCKCLQQCSDKSYTTSISNAHLALDILSANTLGKNLTSRNISLLHIYFGETSCIKYRKTTTMTWDELFATFGGVIGLCLGGSILSMLEIIYYFTIRFWFIKHTPVVSVSPKKVLQSKKPSPFTLKMTHPPFTMPHRPTRFQL